MVLFLGEAEQRTYSVDGKLIKLDTSEIINQGLVKIAADWKEVTEILAKGIENPPSKQTIRKSAFEYLKNHQGGTEIACHLIHQFLNNL